MSLPDLSKTPLEALHAYAEQHYGRRVAKVAGFIVFTSIVLLALYAIGTVLVAAWRFSSPTINIVAKAVSSRDWRAVAQGFSSNWLSTSLSALLFVAIGFSVAWLFRSLGHIQQELQYVVGYLNDNVHVRLVKLREDVDIQGTTLRGVDARTQPPSEKARRAAERMARGEPMTLADLAGLPRPYLAIHSAIYGFGDKWIDVTDDVRARVVDNRLDMPITNEQFGGRDPMKGQRKRLVVTHSIDGGARVVRDFEEKKDRAVLP